VRNLETYTGYRSEEPCSRVSSPAESKWGEQPLYDARLQALWYPLIIAIEVVLWIAALPIKQIRSLNPLLTRRMVLVYSVVTGRFAIEAFKEVLCCPHDYLVSVLNETSYPAGVKIVLKKPSPH
jgi:hypothetical protein